VSQRHSVGFEPPLSSEKTYQSKHHSAGPRATGRTLDLAVGIESRGSARVCVWEALYAVRHEARICVRRRATKRDRSFGRHSLALTLLQPISRSISLLDPAPRGALWTLPRVMNRVAPREFMLGRRYMQSDMKPEFACGVERRRAGRFQRHSVQNVAPRGRQSPSDIARGPIITHIRNKCYIRNMHYSNYSYHIRTIPLARFWNIINSPLRTEWRSAPAPRRCACPALSRKDACAVLAPAPKGTAMG